jgi:DMSO/TMAO reductase YedYZ molybdopterin-dependent catalytic subunit
METGTPVGRRVFLGMLALGGAGIVWGSKVQDFMERTLAPITSRDGTGLSSFLPTGRFRIYTVTGDLPSRSRASYKLTVDGLVDKPFQLDYAELTALPATRLTRAFQCVTGWRVPDVKWVGVRLSDLLDRAGVKPGAGAVSFRSFDGVYTESLSMDQARRPDVIVAWVMEGKPIGHEHGGPVRLYVAPMYGYKSCKWLEAIEVTKKVEGGYWEQYGYDQDGWVGKSNGRDDAPT